MADSVAIIQKAVAGYCLLPTDPEVLETALAGMRRGLDRLNARNWNSALAYDDITFVAGTADYALTNWFKAPRNFEVWDTAGNSVFRLEFKMWKSFLMEHSNIAAESDPCVYTASNPNEFKTVSLNAAPSTTWVSTYPNGRIWYYRRWQYPAGAEFDTPPEFTAFIQSWAEGYTADRHSPQKAAQAYARAREQLHELVVDDCHGQTTDWE